MMHILRTYTEIMFYTIYKRNKNLLDIQKIVLYNTPDSVSIVLNQVLVYVLEQS